MQLNCLAFNKNRLKCLNAKPVQRWCAVQEHRVLANNLFENIPDLGLFALNQLLGCLDGHGQSAPLQLGEDKRLEQLKRHLLGQSALVKLERGAQDRKSTRLNSSHVAISYAVFCLKKKN